MNTDHRLEIALWGTLILSFFPRLEGNMTGHYAILALSVSILIISIAKEALFNKHE